MKKTSAVLLLLICIVAILSAFTNALPDPGFKNLKILPKDITEKQMDSVMNHFSASLNVGCEFCHVKTVALGNENWDWASDKNKHKLVARDMMLMTNKLNDEYFPYSGKAENMSTILTVTCFTCHNGNKEPKTRPKKEN